MVFVCLMILISGSFIHVPGVCAMSLRDVVTTILDQTTVSSAAAATPELTAAVYIFPTTAINKAITISSSSPSVTDTTMMMTASGTCKGGFDQCPDGRCVAFLTMCDDDGGAVTQLAGSSMPVSHTSPTTMMEKSTTMMEQSTMSMMEKSTTMMDQSTMSMMEQSTTMIQTNPPMMSSSEGTTTAATVTETTGPKPTGSGTCHSGFTQCSDGRCEPFATMCEEVDVSTPPGASTTQSMSVPDSTVSTTVPDSTLSTLVTGDLFTTTVAMTTVPMTTIPMTTVPMTTMLMTDTTTTSASGSATTGTSACHLGWEQCRDGSCEPFHFMCTEYSASGLIGK